MFRHFLADHTKLASILIILPSLVSSYPRTAPRANLEPNKNGYDLFSSKDNASNVFQHNDLDEGEGGQAFIVWTHNPEEVKTLPPGVASDGKYISWLPSVRKREIMPNVRGRYHTQHC